MKCAGETFISVIRRDCTGTFKMTHRMTILLILFFSSLNFELCFSGCARAEYEIDGECCPMCSPGNRVYRDCTELSSTTCVPCLAGTFLDAPNGLKNCLGCTFCDPSLGLRVKTACTATSDTVCEPLERYYCDEENRGSCILAKKHRTCDPGQYIKQIGTAVTDTVCGECADGTYSNGSNCQLHSKCEDLGLSEVKPGTLYSDAECGDKAPIGLIAGVISAIIIPVAVAAVFIILKKKHAALFSLPHTDGELPSIPRQETSHGTVSSVMPMLSLESSCSIHLDSQQIPEEVDDDLNAPH
ncbi:tumor necrosis factor receptor superfamily member 5-like [Salminus brasiliensis]|uniref:tumor necrosis factor receptor superfamily member 5-like n=1 Tax=Salminus brasiliensis TaxID=930266 RepID=UPI003B8352FC